MGCHENACTSDRPPSNIVVPFAVDTLRYLLLCCYHSCRDLQTAIIKTCAYMYRSALISAFGEE